MCLGDQARKANEAARRQYQYQIQQREHNWMNTLALENVARVQYDQTLDATHVGLGNTYADLQEKWRDELGSSLQEGQDEWKQFVQENTGAKLAAAGRTGRSVNRIRTVEFGQYLAQGSRRAYELTRTRRDIRKAGAKAAGIARQQQLQAFAQNNIIKTPDIAPPQPVMQNVGLAAFKDALSIISTIATPIAIASASSKKVKDNIVKIGESIQGYNIYKFSYKGSPRRYVGVIAEEIQQTKPEAVVTMPNGVLGVIYDLIDVNFKEVPA